MRKRNKYELFPIVFFSFLTLLAVWYLRDFARGVITAIFVFIVAYVGGILEDYFRKK